MLPGEKATGTLDYTVLASDLGTTITNIATADSDQTEEDTDTNDVPVAAPALNIVKSNDYTDNDASGDVSVGDVITYTFEVENTGTATLTGVTVEDDKLGAVTLDKTTLLPGEKATGTLDYTVLASDLGTTITNIATADSDQTEEDTDTNDVPVAAPALNIVKSNDYTDNDASGDVSVGDVITYTFEVENTGTATLTGVTVEDDKLGAVTLDKTTLLPGEKATGTLDYTVLASDLGTTITNIATADSDQTEEDTDTNDVPVADLNLDIRIVKTSDQEPEGEEDCVELEATDIVTYTFRVTNAGNVPLENVTVTDPLVDLSAIDFVSGDTNNDNILDLNEEWVYTATYEVKQSDIEAGEIVNQATAEGFFGQASDDDLSGATVDTDDETIVPICQDPGVSITKTVLTNDDKVSMVSVSLMITVTNTGNVTLFDHNVEDQETGDNPDD